MQEGRQSTKRGHAMFPNMPDHHLQYVVGERWNDEVFQAALPQLNLNLENLSSKEERRA